MKAFPILVVFSLMVSTIPIFISENVSAEGEEYLEANNDVWGSYLMSARVSGTDTVQYGLDGFLPEPWEAWPQISIRNYNQYRWVGANYYYPEPYGYVGVCEAWFEIEDMTYCNSTSGYYTIQVYIQVRTSPDNDILDSYYIGIGIDADTNIWSESYPAYRQVSGYAYTFNSTTNPNTGLPYTVDEINGLVIKLGNHRHIYSATMEVQAMRVIVTPTEIPDFYSYGYIIRPDGDDTSYYDNAYEYPLNFTPSPYDGIFYDKVNETSYWGDGDDTYLTSNETNHDVGNRFTFTDIPTSLINDYFNITIWVIARVNYSHSSDIAILEYGIYNPFTDWMHQIHAEHEGISPVWANFTYTYEYNPMTSSSFTYDEINNLEVCFHIINSMTLFPIEITQIAVWVIPTEHKYYSDIESPEFEVLIQKNVLGLVWFLFIFIPSIAMGAYVKGIGFIAGLSLMVVILGVVQTSFMPYMFVSLTAIGLLFYKGE